MKKTIALALALMMALSAASLAAVVTPTEEVIDDLAVMPIAEKPIEEETETKDLKALMEKALISVKSRIDVPDDAEFDSYTYSNQLGTVFSFNWNYEIDGEPNHIYVECSEDGFIYSYGCSSDVYYGEYRKLPNVSSVDAEKTASATLRKLMSKGYSAYRLKETPVTKFSNSYSFVYEGVKNNVPIEGSYVHIIVDGINGIATLYNAFPIPEGVEYAAVSEVIGDKKAASAYISLSEAELVYRDFYGEDNVKFIRPVYNVSGKVIDAFTGEEADLYEYIGYDHNAATEEAEMDMAKSAEGMGGVRLSEAEIGALEKLPGLLSLEEIEKKARSFDYFSLNSYKLTNYRLTGYEDQYRWGLDFVFAFDRDKEENAGKSDLNVSMTLDAKTGALLSFYTYDYNATIPSNPDFYIKKAPEEVEKVMKAFVPEKYRESMRLEKNDGLEFTNMSGNDRYIFYNYVRTNEGVLYYSNGVSIRYDCYTGKVSSFNLNWEENITFPSVFGAIGDTAAKKAIAEFYGTDLRYSPVRDEFGDIISYSLVYTVNAQLSAVDALKGFVVDYDGEEYEPEEEAAAGEYPEYIEKLYSVGVTFGEESIDKVDFDEDVTDTELLYMLASAYSRFYGPYPILKENYSPFVSQLSKYGIIKDKIVPKDEKISALQAVVYSLDAFRFGEVAKLSELFKDKGYEDIAKDKVGYAAVSDAMGLLPAGKITDKTITKKEAAAIVYALLEKVQ